jgi:arylsulfatase A-like enzyme
MSRTPSQQNAGWLAILTLTLLSAYFHVFMEWLFFVTKPSSLSTVSFLEKLRAFVVSGGVYALVLAVALVILSIPALLIRNLKWKARAEALRFIPSSFMLSVTALMLIDNFTYTVFKFGIVTSSGFWRILYTLGFILIFLLMFRFVRRTAPRTQRPASFLTLGLFALSTIGILSIHSSIKPYAVAADGGSLNSPLKRPNILILGADGLSANYLSAYGSQLETTPFLDEFVKTSLVAENAFPNVSSTTGSTTSVLTGKESIEVNVYRYPDSLTGDDSFEHLPAILNSLGYSTAEMGTPYYVDAEKVNMLDGFDFINGNSTRQPALDALRSLLGNSPSTYFIQTISERMVERLFHIFFVQDMTNPFKEVNNPKVRMTDAQRTEQIIRLLEVSNKPVFVFAHYMDTHGPHFAAQTDVFPDESADLDKEWDMGQYEDAILGFDTHVKEIYSYLEDSGKLDDTVIVIYTDHGYRYVVNQRIPVIIHFPNGEHAGPRRNNVQILDIPVTLLDYLGITQPDWMRGVSMLGEEPPAERVIISITGGSPKKIAPPFYQIKSVQLIVCQKWYSLNVQENIEASGFIRGYTAPCGKDKLPSDSRLREMVLEYLAAHGYDIGPLQ